jgi:RNA polymerase sigma factor for flagellar operon FliA
MLDELRKTDWTPRSVHRKAREVAEVVRQLEGETGRDADETEVARRLGISLDEYHQVLRDAASCRLLSLSGSGDEDGEGIDVADEGGMGPAQALEANAMQTALAEAIDGLPEREKLVMSLYYDEELNLKEIGEVLGVTESRVCQIHGQALVRLRARMDEWLRAD